jgi:hypothetical protein
MTALAASDELTSRENLAWYVVVWSRLCREDLA